MRIPVGFLLKLSLTVALVATGAPPLHAQISNRVWFVIYNGKPTPSSDVSVQTLDTDGSAAAVAAGAAVSFVSQTNFPSFNSPFDIALDPAMGKVYVLDNNVQDSAQAGTPECIYSFNLNGTPAQIAASGKIIYTMLVPSADVNAGLYPLISGLALDSSQHLLYFNQIDVTTGTNSFVGQLNLTTSSNSDLYSSANGNPAFQAYYSGQIPGQGPLALDATNFYIGAISRLGNSGVFAAPRSGSGTFAELVVLSTGDITFTNGFTGGVASDPRDHLVYYLTSNAGILNGKYDVGKNAVWVYDTVARTNTKISSGYPGYPDNLAVDPANNRYYFTLGRDGTGNPTPTNYQAIYTGILGSTNTPTLFYKPVLSGQDTNGNVGNVVLQGIFIEDLLPSNGPPGNRMAIDSGANGWTLLFTGISSQNYAIQSADSPGGPWSDLSPVLTADPAGVVEYNDLTSPPAVTRFYRVRTSP